MKTELRTRSRTTLGEIVRLHNSVVADKGLIDEYYGDLGKAGSTKVTYDFRRDRRTTQLCSCQHNATAEVKCKEKG